MTRIFILVIIWIIANLTYNNYTLLLTDYYQENQWKVGCQTIRTNPSVLISFIYQPLLKKSSSRYLFSTGQTVH